MPGRCIEQFAPTTAPQSHCSHHVDQATSSPGTSPTAGTLHALHTSTSRPSFDPPSHSASPMLRASAVRWLWHGRIPLGRFTVLDGDPGLGKSALLLDLAARLTVGRPMPDEPEHPTTDAQPRISRPFSSCPPKTTSPTRSALVSKPPAPTLRASWPSPTYPYVWESASSVFPPTSLSWARSLNAPGCACIVDPLVAYLNPRVNTHSDAALRATLASLLYVVEALGLAVVLVLHLAKRSARNALYRGAGSIGLLGAARSGLVARDPDDPSGGAPPAPVDQVEPVRAPADAGLSPRHGPQWRRSRPVGRSLRPHPRDCPDPALERR